MEAATMARRTNAPAAMASLSRRPHSESGLTGRKDFFFEKKKQKTFALLGRAHLEKPKPKHPKVFWFFFSKKNCFLHPI
jgi:hypothetical protein